MKALFLVASLVLSPALLAESITVTCSGKIQGKTESVRLKLNQGKIVQWDEEKWGVSKGDYLGVYNQNIEEYGFEWTNSMKARNGYAILELGTTADAHKIGVNVEEGKGFYQYSDHGSGAGNLGPVTLKCRKN